MNQIGKEKLHLLAEVIRKGFKIDESTPCVVETVVPERLLVPDRMDIALKLYYIDAKVRGLEMEAAQGLFLRQVSAITAFTNKENGNAEKNSANCFLEVFDKLIEDFKKGCYDSSKSIIPVSDDGIILDGAHRVACAIYFHQPIEVIRFPHIKRANPDFHPGKYDYRYFQNYLLPQEDLDIAALQYAKYTQRKLYLACLWPAATGEENREKAICKLPSVIYKKNIPISYSAFSKFVAQVYVKESWVGNIKDGFEGTDNKAIPCFKEHSELTCALFEVEEDINAIALKEEIRNIFSIDKHSIHITDTSEDAVRLCNIVFSNNSLSILEHLSAQSLKNMSMVFEQAEEGRVLNLSTSKYLSGLSREYTFGYVDSDRIKKMYSENDILRDETASFVFLGKKFIYPSKRVISKYYETVDGRLIEDQDSIFVKVVKKTTYYTALFKIKIINRLYKMVVKVRNRKRSK